MDLRGGGGARGGLAVAARGAGRGRRRLRALRGAAFGAVSTLGLCTCLHDASDCEIVRMGVSGAGLRGVRKREGFLGGGGYFGGRGQEGRRERNVRRGEFLFQGAP